MFRTRKLKTRAGTVSTYVYLATNINKQIRRVYLLLMVIYLTPSNMGPIFMPEEYNDTGKKLRHPMGYI